MKPRNPNCKPPNLTAHEEETYQDYRQRNEELRYAQEHYLGPTTVVKKDETGWVFKMKGPR